MRPRSEEIHESFARLMDWAQEATKATQRPIQTYSDLARELNASPSTVTNWRARGVPFEAAVYAEMAFGVSPSWVIWGTQPPIAPQRSELPADVQALINALMRIPDPEQRSDAVFRAEFAAFQVQRPRLPTTDPVPPKAAGLPTPAPQKTRAK